MITNYPSNQKPLTAKLAKVSRSTQRTARAFLRELCAAFAKFAATSAPAQDWIKTGTGLGVEKIRIAVPDFKASNQDPRNTELLKTFNDVLWSDLDNAGIFD